MPEAGVGGRINRGIVVTSQDLGSDDCGHLLLPVSCRATSLDAWRHVGVERLAADSVYLSPDSVLYCGHHPDRPGSIRWFSYMAELQVLVTGLVSDSVEWLSLSTAPPFHRRDMASMLNGYLSRPIGVGGGSARRARTRTSFRYQVPDGEALDRMYSLVFSESGFS